jgi:hypothetical protein
MEEHSKDNIEPQYVPITLDLISALRELQERRKDANYDIKVKLGLMDNTP